MSKSRKEDPIKTFLNGQLEKLHTVLSRQGAPEIRQLRAEAATTDMGKTCHLQCPSLCKELNSEYYWCGLFSVRINSKLDREFVCRMHDPSDIACKVTS